MPIALRDYKETQTTFTLDLELKIYLYLGSWVPQSSQNAFVPHGSISQQ